MCSLSHLLFLVLPLCAVVGAIQATNSSFLPSNAARQLTYKIKKGDVSCARKNVEMMRKKAPLFFYNVTSDDERAARSNAGKDAIPNAWEPVLEPVRGCNGLNDGWTLQLSFTVVLDKSWVAYYNKNKRFFAREGYQSLTRSVRMLTDRADYLYRKQFGISLRISQVVALPELDEDCAKNDELADPSSKATLRALRRAGKDVKRGDANLLRFGTNFKECSSYVDGDARLCDRVGLSMMAVTPFTPDGRIKYDAAQTVAHELAHFLGVCDDERGGHCTDGHVRNEIPDIMVWEPWVYGPKLRHGFVFKFFTTCTPVYRDLLCPAIRRAKCARRRAPPGLAGAYFATKFRARARKQHYVSVTEKRAGRVYVWKDRTGATCTLTRRKRDASRLDVDRKCPYYRRGFKVAKVRTRYRNGRMVVTAIYGPLNELYELK